MNSRVSSALFSLTMLATALGISGVCAEKNKLSAVVAPIASGPFQPTWESLKKHPVPTWFRDAKFGIYFHWGVYSVPAYENEWYSRNMYVNGSSANQYHLKHYGPLWRFGYKDFIPMFTAEKFNADEWAELFGKAGAKFAGPVAEHADGFAMWGSRLSKWNAAAMGPKRDVVGEMAKALRRRGLKFVTTFHHQWLWGWYPTMDKTTDASNPEYSRLYGPAVPPSAFNYDHPTPWPDQRFCKLWVGKVKEVIDKYWPDLIYFDSRMHIIDEEYRKELIAYYYNKEREWGREVGLTYKVPDLPDGVAIVDLERGRMSDLTEYIWLTDDSIDWNSWCHVQNPNYKSVKRLVDELVDIVSKNGNLLLNIPPKANGEIPEPVKERLVGLGAWLKVNGEAIYGTRPWKVFGEGPTKVEGGPFSEHKNKDFTAEDIRFTTKGNILYAIVLGIPKQDLKITSLGKSAGLAEKTIAGVKLLGSEEKLRWTQEADALVIKCPQKIPCKHAVTFKISFLE